MAIMVLISSMAPAAHVQATGYSMPAAASTPVAVYSDGLASGWVNWSWNTTSSLSNTSPVQSGTRSIAFSIDQAWGALYLHSDVPPKTSGFTHLEFYIHGGTSGAQQIYVIANGNTSKAVLVTTTLNAWKKVSVALTSLGSPAALAELYFQDAQGKAQPKMYLDTLRLVDNRPPTATPTKTATKARTAAPSKTPTKTPTKTATLSGSKTATKTPTKTATLSGSKTATKTPTKTATLSGSKTVTKTPTKTAAPTKSATPTAPKTSTPTKTKTPTPLPSATKTPGGRFNTLPPGAQLPSDAACAAAVRAAPENKRMNVTYNAKVGGQTLGTNFFTASDPRANSLFGPRVTGNYTGTTDQILQWVACKWGLDEDIVRAQAAVESWWQQTTKGDWTSDAALCAPGHGLGVDGVPGQCPESFGILQNRYIYEKPAWPGMYNSTAFNADTAYAIMRACYEGYEWWLNDVDRGWDYGAGDVWGCVGRWYSGRWHTSAAEYYISKVKDYLNTRVWETPGFQEP